MIEFDCEEVKRQLNRLAGALPEDRVDIWLKWEPPTFCYTIYCAERKGMPSVIESAAADELVAGVDRLIANAGPRLGQDIVAAKRRKIEEARAELAKLEAEIDPLVLAVDTAQADAAKESSV